MHVHCIQKFQHSIIHLVLIILYHSNPFPNKYIIIISLFTSERIEYCFLPLLKRPAFHFLGASIDKVTVRGRGEDTARKLTHRHHHHIAGVLIKKEDKNESCYSIWIYHKLGKNSSDNKLIMYGILIKSHIHICGWCSKLSTQYYNHSNLYQSIYMRIFLLVRTLLICSKLLYTYPCMHLSRERML